MYTSIYSSCCFIQSPAVWIQSRCDFRSSQTLQDCAQNPIRTNHSVWCNRVKQLNSERRRGGGGWMTLLQRCVYWKVELFQSTPMKRLTTAAKHLSIWHQTGLSLKATVLDVNKHFRSQEEQNVLGQNCNLLALSAKLQVLNSKVGLSFDKKSRLHTVTHLSITLTTILIMSKPW